MAPLPLVFIYAGASTGFAASGSRRGASSELWLPLAVSGLPESSGAVLLSLSERSVQIAARRSQSAQTKYPPTGRAGRALDLEPVARPRTRPTRPMPPRRAQSPPRRTAVLGAAAAPRRGRPTLLGVEDSTFISGAEDF